MSVLRPHTASNGSAGLSSQKKALSKDDAREDEKTKDVDYWNHGGGSVMV